MRYLIITVILIGLSVIPLKSHACGHEGWYFGGGYSQLFQASPDKQLIAGGGRSTNNVRFQPRYGGYVKLGHDWCASRMGIEIPFSYNRQRLNRQELVDVLGTDVNAVIHLAETTGGADFYWIAGTGFNITTDGTVNNGTGAAGINLNTGPGFQYFFARGKHKAALGISVPFKYTLYFRNNLSARKTQVIGIPVMFGLTVGF